MTRCVRALAVVALVFTLSTLLAIAPAAQAEPAAPANPSQFATLFVKDGPNGALGLWVWDPSGRLFGAAGWHFAPAEISPLQAAPNSPPPWPEDVLKVQAVAAATTDGIPQGYWVWNPYRFVGGNGGPHSWSPTWEWHTTTQ